MNQSADAFLTGIRDYISREFIMGLSDAKLGDDDNFIEAGIVDSYGLIEIITFVESEFSIQLTDEDLVSPDLTTIAGLSRLVSERSQ